MSIDTTELAFSTDGKEIPERLHALGVAQATGAATLAGAQATQAAAQAGTTATNSAMQVGTKGTTEAIYRECAPKLGRGWWR